MEPAPDRKRRTTWKTFLQANWEVLSAADFTTFEIWTRGGLVTFYLFFVIQLKTRVRWNTPDEIYHNLPPANEQPRIEPRASWPLESRCAQPRAPVDVNPGVIVELDVSHVAGRKHLPIVTLRRVA